jgi:PAS domain S-box-containing protein
MSLTKIKSFFEAVKETESLQQLRRRILDRFLIGATVIGTVLFVFSSIPLIERGLYSTIVLYGVIYIFTLTITIVRKLPYGLRVGSYLGLFYFFGVLNIAMSGFNVDAGLFFLALVTMTMLLIGRKGGLAAIGLSLLTITVMGFMIVNRTINLSLGLSQRDPLLWVIGGGVFFLVSFLLIMAFNAVVQGLETNLSKTSELIRKIEESFKLHQESDQRYRALIEGSTDIIVILTREGKIKFASPSVNTVLGYTPEELLEKNIIEYIHAEDAAIAFDALGPNVPADQIGPKLDLRLRHKDGSWRDLEVRGREMHTTPGIYGTVVSCRDITVRKRALAELRESSLFLEKMFSGLCDGVIITDKENGTILDCNAAALELFGYEKDELVGHSAVMLHEDDVTRQEFYKQTTPAMEEQGVLTHVEYQMKRKSGALFPVEVSITPINDRDGKTSSWASVVRDISDRKRTEGLLADERESLRQDVIVKTTELQKTNEKLRELVVLSPSVIYHIGAGRNSPANFVTENVKSVLGYDANEITDDPEFWKKHVHPDDIDRVTRELEKVSKQNGGVIEYQFLHLDGRYRWIHDEIRVVRNDDGQPVDMVGSWYDMTDRKLAEEALKASETKYRELYTSMMDAYDRVDMDGNLVEFNEIFQQLTGYEPEELQKLTYQDLTPAYWHQLEKEIIEKQVLPRGYSDVYEKEYIRKDGRVVPVELRTMVIRNNQGIPTGMWALVRDISDRKRIEHTLLTSEVRYRTLAEAAHDIIFIVDRQDRIIYVNTFAADIFHCNPDDMIGQMRTKYFTESTDSRQRGSLEGVFLSGEALYTENVTEFPNGEKWLSTWLVPFRDGSGQLTEVLGVSRDITERKTAEETLVRFGEQLEEQVAQRTTELVASQKQLRMLASQVVKAQEEERRRISRELHDEAGQALISLKYNLDSVAGEIPAKFISSHRKLNDSARIIDQAMGLIRGLSHSLRPPVLDVGGLNLSLRELCWDFSQRTGLQINYSGDDIPGLPDEIGISLYRFAQEATVNILKHSEATEADFQLEYQNGEVTLSVRDNGKGMDQNGLTGGIGLLGIEERIGLLGGTLAIKSITSQGVSLTARIPWSADTQANQEQPVD